MSLSVQASHVRKVARLASRVVHRQVPGFGIGDRALAGDVARERRPEAIADEELAHRTASLPLGPAFRFSEVDGARRPEGLEEAAIVRHQHDRAHEPFDRRFELFDRL